MHNVARGLLLLEGYRGHSRVPMARALRGRLNERR
jgi:hypothetical protein